MNLILGFIMSIISGVVANLIFKRLEIYNEFSLKQEPKKQFKSTIETMSDTEKEQIREENKRVLRDKINTTFFYVFTYILVSAAIFYPIMLHNGLISGNLDLSKTKLVINYVINKEYFLFISSLLGFIFYIPILYLSRRIARFISSFVTHYKEVTKVRFNLIRIPIIIFFSAFIMANMYWIIKLNILWWDAIKFTFSIILFLFAMGINQ